ncbi:DUF4834 family protein [Pedobacter insulae]|uniref:DUF4834 domain-containing protein n=1 Tax=Pedobacter insulae TaxID=414048 RepID=A0A1I2TBP5_9SPHI|nr:DUF4834 domain-containing protein [Pedobacter insulae]SFG61539.1 protein of unknown function [Pedobacter insulae]
MGYLIKFIFITIIILWVIRLLIRLIFPVMLKNMFGNVQQQAANANQQQRPPKPEGSISIDYMPKKEKKGNADKLGDFVDYEEVK